MSKLRPPSRKCVEAAANAIKFLVPLNGFDVNTGMVLSGWTEKGLREVKWPKGFTAQERKLIREIARRALTTGQQE